MPDISKLSGVSESNIKNVDSVLKSNISNISGQGFSSVTYFLDTYSGASLAFSFRQLSGSATNCIDVINSNGITQTIGFSSGYVDTSAISSLSVTLVPFLSSMKDVI